MANAAAFDSRLLQLKNKQLLGERQEAGIHLRVLSLIDARGIHPLYAEALGNQGMRPLEVHFIWHEALAHEAFQRILLHVALHVDLDLLLNEIFFGHEAMSMQRTGLRSICPGGQLEALARSTCVTVSSHDAHDHLVHVLFSGFHLSFITFQ